MTLAHPSFKVRLRFRLPIKNTTSSDPYTLADTSTAAFQCIPEAPPALPSANHSRTRRQQPLLGGGYVIANCTLRQIQFASTEIPHGHPVPAPLLSLLLYSVTLMVMIVMVCTTPSRACVPARDICAPRCLSTSTRHGATVPHGLLSPGPAANNMINVDKSNDLKPVSFDKNQCRTALKYLGFNLLHSAPRTTPSTLCTHTGLQRRHVGTSPYPPSGRARRLLSNGVEASAAVSSSAPYPRMRAALLSR
ncbi:hypothetical protein B0H10DRAFT_2436893 [Mycena sp. CBHHK59/15]|nr:hypothetical protein B0H10DRAFT_2436893 [Mycena sp. CBHHK59/15]